MSTSSPMMSAGILLGPHQLEIQQMEIPEPGRGEVRIKMELLGICGSDVSLYLGHRTNTPFPLVIGHEGVGWIEKMGSDVQGFEIGQRVVIEPNFPCGSCEWCWQGRGNICPHKRIFGVLEAGCFAEYAVGPAKFAWKIPATLSNEDAVMIEPLAVALHTLYTAPARPGDVIEVLGLGAIGLLLVQLAVRMGYQVLAYDRVEAKTELAARLGARAIPANTDTAELAQIWQKAQVSSVFECAGAAPALSQVLASAPRGATIVVAGLADQPSAITEFQLARQGQQVLSSIIYQHPQDFRRTIVLLENGFIQPSRLISSRYAFIDLPTAIRAAAGGLETKVVVAV